MSVDAVQYRSISPAETAVAVRFDGAVGGVLSGATVKLAPLLANPPIVTTMFPVVAPAGTGATMLVLLQLVGVANVPLKATVLVP